MYHSLDECVSIIKEQQPECMRRHKKSISKASRMCAEETKYNSLCLEVDFTGGKNPFSSVSSVYLSIFITDVIMSSVNWLTVKFKAPLRRLRQRIYYLMEN